MTDYDMLGRPIGGKRSKNTNPFGGNLNVGSGLGASNDKPTYERVPVSSSQKTEILNTQKGKCAGCGLSFHEEGVRAHFDHIRRVETGGASKLDNLQALCPTCHDKKTHKENVQKIEKTRKKPKKKEESSLFSGGIMFGQPPKRSKNNPFGL